MLTQFLDRAAPLASLASVRPVVHPDPGFDAIPRLDRLASDLVAASGGRRPRWKETPLFFFDTRRQSDLKSVVRSRPISDPYAGLSERIAAELPSLFASIVVRQVARAVPGLRAAAERLAPVCPAAKDLAELLEVPDDEVVVVLHPALRLGFRFVVRGIADIGQLHLLLAAVLGESLPGQPIPRRFVNACRDTNPTTAAGVPMVAEARFQMYTAKALDAKAELPRGFAGSDHWLWPQTPLGALPRVGGERVVLLGPPAYRMTWDITRRFPAMAAELQPLEMMSQFRVAERLEKLTGNPVPATARGPEPALSRAA